MLRLLAVAGLAVLIAGTAASAASAADDIDPLSAFTITGPSFSGVNVVTLSGDKDTGSGVQVLSQTTGQPPVCTIAPNPSSTWTCSNIALPNGAGHVITGEEIVGPDVVSRKTLTIDVLGAPAIDGGSGHTTGVISGSGFAGATVTASVDGTGSGACSGVVAGSGYWSCPLALSTGQWNIRATQSRNDIGAGADSSLSGAVTIMIDKDAPAAPAITSPRASSTITSRGVTISGRGEDGGTLNVYLDDALACSTTVDPGGGWSCPIGAVPRGNHAVRAIQRDDAGNFSAPSQSISLRFSTASAGNTPDPEPSAPAETPTPTPSEPSEPPLYPPYDDSPTPPPATSPWAIPTGFGASLPTLAETAKHGNWLFAPLVGLAFLLLVALPLLLVATVLRGRVRKPRMRFTGRNREPLPEDAEEPPPINPWLAGAVPFAVAVGLVVVSTGVAAEPRYLRLTIAVAVGLAVLNLLGVALPALGASHLLGAGARNRFLPMLLIAAALTALLSRVTGIDPPVVIGVLIGVGLPAMVRAKSAALVNLAQVGAVTLLGVLAWFGHGWLGQGDGFWLGLGSETLATIAFAGFGSALVLVLPVGRLPGRAILAWSKTGWVIVALVVATLAGALYLGGPQVHFPLVGSLVTVGAFAAISLAIWGWLRYVEPATR